MGRGAWLALLAIGCTQHDVAGVLTDDTRSFTQRFDDSPALDVLFVVDSSRSMEEEQHGLSRAFSRFAWQLDGLGSISWRIGVTTTDLGAFGHPQESCEDDGDGGRLRIGDPSCGAPPDPWLWRSGAETNAPDGDVGRALACLADVGADGCAYEMPLLAARRVLDAERGRFLRRGATLAVIIVTDEDDCSVVDPALLDPAASWLGPATGFRCFAHGVACAHGPDEPTEPGPRDGCEPAPGFLIDPAAAARELREGVAAADRVLLAVIAGPPSPIHVGTNVAGEVDVLPSCVSGMGRAGPAVRLDAAIRALADGGLSISLCDGDFAPALEAVGSRLAGAAQDRCLFAAPLECSVIVHGEALPECEGEGEGEGCWRLVDDPTCASGVSLDAPGGNVEITCTTP